MNAQHQTVSFHGQPIPVFTQDNQHYVAMKPICENIGLDWSAQYRKIKRNAVLDSGVAIMATPDKNNRGQQQSICLQLELLNGWLFTIEVNKVKPEIRPRLLQYQRECFDVLAAHFMRPIAPPPAALPSVADKLPSRHDVYHIYLMLGERMKEIHNWGDIDLDKYMQERRGKTADTATYSELVSMIRHLHSETTRFVQRDQPLRIMDPKADELGKLLHSDSLRPIAVTAEYALRLADGVAHLDRALAQLDSSLMCRLSTTAHEIRIHLRRTLDWLQKMDAHSPGRHPFCMSNGTRAERLLEDMKQH